MDKNINMLKETAETARSLYKRGSISREEAKKDIIPYINACNEKSIELAKKYNQKPKKIQLASFLR